MCKLERIYWIVIKTNKPISKRLINKISKVRTIHFTDNVLSFFYIEDNEFKDIVSILKEYKKTKFEVVKFTDKQFGLSLNFWNGIDKEKIDKLPLKHRFYWYEENNKLQTVTPITEKQFNNIIKINF